MLGRWRPWETWYNFFTKVTHLSLLNICPCFSSISVVSPIHISRNKNNLETRKTLGRNICQRSNLITVYVNRRPPNPFLTVFVFAIVHEMENTLSVAIWCNTIWLRYCKHSMGKSLGKTPHLPRSICDQTSIYLSLFWYIGSSISCCNEILCPMYVYSAIFNFCHVTICKSYGANQNEREAPSNIWIRCLHEVNVLVQFEIL